MVDIIVPVYNRPELLEGCVGRLPSTTTVPYQLTLINDASPDKRVDEALRKHSRAKIMHNSQNMGFGATVNKAVRATTAPYVCVLNQDTEPLPGWLDVLVADLEANPDHGIVAPLLMFHPMSRSGPGGAVQHCGMYFDINKVPKHRYIGWPMDNPRVRQYRDDLQIVSGACILIKRRLWDQLGGFAREYGRGTFEDVELCLKTKLLQYKVCYNPDAMLYHHVGGSVSTVEGGYPLQLNYRVFMSRLGGTVAQYDEWLVNG